MNMIFAGFFALLSLSAAAAPGLDQEIVIVNGTPIRQSEVMEKLWKRYGPQTVDEMIDDLLLRQEAQKKGIKADSKDVEKRLSKLEEQFGSRELFLGQLEQAGSSLAKVREDLGDEIVREKLIRESMNLKVTDDELKKAFEENKEHLGRPEAVHLRHILVSTEDEAKSVVAKIKSGGDFAALAREKSLAASGKTVGGDYGFVARGMLPSEIDQIAFSMKPGEIRIVPGPRGAHVLQVLAIRPPKPAAFAQAKDDLREILMTEKIKKAAGEYLRQLRQKAELHNPNAPAAAAPAGAPR